MKTSNFQSSQTFRGLNLSKVNLQDMEKVIRPCINGLKKLAKKADISLESSAKLQEFEHYKTPRPVINIIIKPLEGIKSKTAISQYSMIIDNMKKQSLLNITKKLIKIL